MHEKEGEEDEVKSIDIVHEDDTYIVFQNGLRLSKPYAFDFIANVKRRWCEVENEEENNIVDIFHKEFPNLPREYYAQAFKDGRLRVEDKNASSVSRSHKKKRKKEDDEKEYFPALVPGQTVRHLVHKHEPPVLCSENEIEILEEVDDIVAVRKPATVPVHPTGQYRNNSVVEILRQRLPEMNDKKNTSPPSPLLPLHRLDRNVSGLLLMAKTSKAAKIATDLIVSNKVRKEYVARVKGLFSKEETTCEVPLGFCGKTHVATWPSDSSTPSPLYKSAKTSFTLIKHFSELDESLVRCVPETGRTHQIRAHLKILGHPIANDVVYGGRLSPGQTKLQDEYQKMCHSFTGRKSCCYQ
jgi:RluA family pseudouridine synthase